MAREGDECGKPALEEQKSEEARKQHKWRLARASRRAIFDIVTTRVAATYEGKVLKLRKALPLPLHSEVMVTVETNAQGDPDRQDWIAASEAALLKTWDNPADDVFNQLREA
ncbi:MAG: hypothetical protein ACRDHZ_14210 [Ktedonobacteraceae bacterium]